MSPVGAQRSMATTKVSIQPFATVNYCKHDNVVITQRQESDMLQGSTNSIDDARYGGAYCEAVRGGDFQRPLDTTNRNLIASFRVAACI